MSSGLGGCGFWTVSATAGSAVAAATAAAWARKVRRFDSTVCFIFSFVPKENARQKVVALSPRDGESPGYLTCVRLSFLEVASEVTTLLTNRHSSHYNDR